MISKPYYALLLADGKLVARALERERALEKLAIWQYNVAHWHEHFRVIAPPKRCVALVRITPRYDARNDAYLAPRKINAPAA